MSVHELKRVGKPLLGVFPRWLWLELGIAAELSGAASMAALLQGRVRPAPGEKICALVCGAGRDGIG